MEPNMMPAIPLTFGVSLSLVVVYLSLKRKISLTLTLLWFPMCLLLMAAGFFHTNPSIILLSVIVFTLTVFTLYLLVKINRANLIIKNLVQHLAITKPFERETNR
jgi:hypothetical protein